MILRNIIDEFGTKFVFKNDIENDVSKCMYMIVNGKYHTKYFMTIISLKDGLIDGIDAESKLLNSEIVIL